MFILFLPVNVSAKVVNGDIVDSLVGTLGWLECLGLEVQSLAACWLQWLCILLIYLLGSKLIKGILSRLLISELISIIHIK